MRTFTSPAYHASVLAPLDLADRVATAEHMAHLPGGLLIGDEVTVLWGVAQSAAVEWAELAICVGQPALGAITLLRVVGALDITGPLASSQPNEAHVSTLTIAAPFDAPADLWLVAVAKHLGGGQFAPALVAPWWTDPLRSGLVATANGYEQPPSALMALGQLMAFGPSGQPRPFHAVMQVPTRCGCVGEPEPSSIPQSLPP